MRKWLTGISARLYGFFSMLLILHVPVFASPVPYTGDNRGRFLWIAVVVLIIALAAIIILGVTGKKGKI